MAKCDACNGTGELPVVVLQFLGDPDLPLETRPCPICQNETAPSRSGILLRSIAWQLGKCVGLAVNGNDRAISVHCG